MNGFASAARIGMNANERLHSIHVDRKAIRLALSQLETQRQRQIAIQGEAMARPGAAMARPNQTPIAGRAPVRRTGIRGQRHGERNIRTVAAEPRSVRQPVTLERGVGQRSGIARPP